MGLEGKKKIQYTLNKEWASPRTSEEMDGTLPRIVSFENT